MEATMLGHTELPAKAADRLQHGAHMECQEGAPFVTLACGIAADWHENDGTTPESTKTGWCKVCSSGPKCPLCGTKLGKP